jgi:DNA-binding MarR family transcriptional regulator
MSLLSQQVVGVRNPDKLRGCAPKKPISRYTPAEEAANREIEQRMIAALTPKSSMMTKQETAESRNKKFLEACAKWTLVSDLAQTLGWDRKVFKARSKALLQQGRIEGRGGTTRREYRAVKGKAGQDAERIFNAVGAGTTAREIADITGLHVSTVASTLANLARQGKVERIRGGGDRSFIYRKAEG